MLFSPDISEEEILYFNTDNPEYLDYARVNKMCVQENTHIKFTAPKSSLGINLKNITGASSSASDQNQEIAYKFTYIAFAGLYIQCEKASDQPLGSPLNRGWKLHVSIDDTQDDGNLERGSNILWRYVMWFGLTHCKVIEHFLGREMLKSTPDQIGREFTIYAFKDTKTPDQWKIFMEAVTRALVANNVRPGPLAPLKYDDPNDIQDERAIRNSNYFSRRNDGPKSDDPFATIFIDQNIQQLPRNPSVAASSSSSASLTT